MSNFVDKLHEFFDELENKLGSMLHGTQLAEEVKADAADLVTTARAQVTGLAETVEADASTDLSTVEADVSAITGNAAKPTEPAAPSPQIQPTEPANPAEAPQG